MLLDCCFSRLSCTPVRHVDILQPRPKKAFYRILIFQNFFSKRSKAAWQYKWRHTHHSCCESAQIKKFSEFTETLSISAMFLELFFFRETMVGLRPIHSLLNLNPEK